MGWIRVVAAAGAVVVTGCTASGAIGASAHTESAAAWAASPRTVVVGYTSRSLLAAALRGTDARLIQVVVPLRTAELRTRGTAAALAQVLAHRTGIRYAEPVAPRAGQVEPAASAGADAAFEWEYAAARENSVPPWVLRAASGITIATVDTGADLSVPDLAAKSPSAYDVLTQTSDVRDLNGHGTFVASLAAGSVTNGDGMSGFGGDARLLVIRAGRPDGSFTDVDEAAGIAYAVDHGARIVNLSLGGPTTSTTERDAIAYAANHGVLVVAAAGNERQSGNPVEYPAALVQPVDSDGVGGVGLAVGASTSAGGRAPFSNTGSYLSLAAPGVNVLGAVAPSSSPILFPRVRVPGAKGIYGLGTGTSFAAPEVAGAAALVWAANPALGAADVAQILKETASGLGSWSPDLGYGVVDVAAAVARAAGTPTVLLSVVPSGNRVHLTWSGSGASYEISASEDGGPEQTLVSATTGTDAWLPVTAGHAYTFTVGAFDATGKPVAVSSPASVRIPLAPSSLSIAAAPRGQAIGGIVRVTLTAVLRSDDDGGGPTASRTVRLELRVGGSWRAAGTARTNRSGRVTWSIPLHRGSYAVRATFQAGEGLAASHSRALPLVVR